MPEAAVTTSLVYEVAEVPKLGCVYKMLPVALKFVIPNPSMWAEVATPLMW